MSTHIKGRIEIIDFLKGLVMVIMALDHTRDYFHASAFIYDPTDPNQTSFPIYFTRWITHFCAPAFSFLAGISAFFVGRRKKTGELSSFLFKRGLWLIFIEVTIVNFAWFFDIQFRTDGLAVIWALGISMIVLAALVYLPRTVILVFSCVLIFGHNLLDSTHFDGNIWWAILHDGGFFKFSDHFQMFVGYPIIPWIAVMSLGYCFGPLYDKSFDRARRKRILNIIGFSAVILFIIVRWINIYGDPYSWKHYDTAIQTLFNFMNPMKYPPSLSYLLMTLGPMLIILANSENLKGRIANFFKVFGRVPFFYYIVHLYLIHLTALIFAQLSGFGWQNMILKDWVGDAPELKGYGFRLWVVYAVWIGIITLHYPLCKKFDLYKQKNREKWWLSYL